MIRRALPFLLLCLTVLLAPASAQAAKSQKKAIWGPIEIDGESQFPVYKDLGVGTYQMLLEWDKVGVLEPLDAKDPEDASYEWSDEIDTAISEGSNNGIKVALSITGRPDWASASDFKDFVTAAAKRYKAVRTWAIGDGKVSPAKDYPRMLDDAYAALKAASKSNKVIGGNGNTRLELSNGKQARMDYFGTDPTARKAPTKSTLNALKRKAGDHKLWLGPVSLPTSEGGSFRLTMAAQANWIKTAFRLVKSDSDVAALSYRKLRDELGAPFTGLMDSDGEKKPSYNAYKQG
ncbi:hypothetical protein DVA67_015540 [Solirubrobacter sp. CPCC 204708]|uniref:Glycoside hydrolase family 42 N-terminal domain-containing protein n=1 Tax=Solirubrobacter deserti TaxID=2282478 RepID=A0ABT4RN27_9ACTN|nr:hypothetical protein [Solirubrobacter deserti]MBE2317395.1 hypothetical protein [Solirubrobacter deserti]MDA0139977.1 hypothetical protein [Solirubrobacter deserti]